MPVADPEPLWGHQFPSRTEAEFHGRKASLSIAQSRFKGAIAGNIDDMLQAPTPTAAVTSPRFPSQDIPAV